MDKRQIFTVIFGKENVSDEELWTAGYGICNTKIEVDTDNIAKYNNQYKQHFLCEKILYNFQKRMQTSWVELPKKQNEQIDAVMKLITYSVISLEDCITVKNVTSSTIHFLNRLGYDAWGGEGAGWIRLYGAKKSILEGQYLTAETAETISNLINCMVLWHFLQERKQQGVQFVIIPTSNISRIDAMDRNETNTLAGEVLQKLGLEFELDILMEFHTHNPLTFINLSNLNTQKEVEVKEIGPLRKYLPEIF